MNKYDTPPIMLMSDLSRAFTENEGAPDLSDAVIETKPARFLVFMGEDSGWVLRDYHAGRDYPFLTKPGAIAGMERRVTEGRDYIGSPVEVNAYGEPLENVEAFA